MNINIENMYFADIENSELNVCEIGLMVSIGDKIFYYENNNDNNLSLN